MRKLRDDSTWNRLSPEQRETLEEWLFDENAGYAEVVKRVKEQFGLEASVASVGRFYRRRAGERQTGELLAAQVAANDLNALPVSFASLRVAALKLAAKAALTVASESPKDVEQLVSLTRLLIENEEIEIRRGRLKLAQQYFDYEATADSLKEMPRLRAYLDRIADDTELNEEEKIQKVHAILFGWNQARQNRSEAKGEN